MISYDGDTFVRQPVADRLFVPLMSNREYRLDCLMCFMAPTDQIALALCEVGRDVSVEFGGQIPAGWDIKDGSRMAFRRIR